MGKKEVYCICIYDRSKDAFKSTYPSIISDQLSAMLKSIIKRAESDSELHTIHTPQKTIHVSQTEGFIVIVIAAKEIKLRKLHRIIEQIEEDIYNVNIKKLETLADEANQIDKVEKLSKKVEKTKEIMCEAIDITLDSGEKLDRTPQIIPESKIVTVNKTKKLSFMGYIKSMFTSESSNSSKHKRPASKKAKKKPHSNPKKNANKKNVDGKKFRFEDVYTYD